jgi:iron-sulfur cluster repair protein YtfE (RIC family)
MRVKDIPNATPEQMLQNLLDVVTSLKDGHFTAHAPVGFPGLYGEIAKTLNAHMDMLTRFKQEHERIMEEVGVTGRLGGQMEVREVCGAWKEMHDGVNRMAAHVTNQFRDGANVVHDLLGGDGNARMTAQDIHGEFSAFSRNLNKLANDFTQRKTAAAM